MSRHETDKKFWQLAAGVAAEDERMINAVQWMMHKTGPVSFEELDTVTMAIAEVCEQYGLSNDTDASSAAVDICEKSLRRFA